MVSKLIGVATTTECGNTRELIHIHSQRYRRPRSVISWQVLLADLGLFGSKRILTPGQAAIALVVLFFFSRRHANALQRQFEAVEAQRKQDEQRKASLVKRKRKGQGKGD
ncbi:hypothetical protein R1sor_025118 [Riccia sorocarpa]|uniref:Transmembrane protein n=1 Tax=Riccia sorocarpa TaxID=122646 RepID=A0ABD3GAS9_9MARC